MDTKLILVAAHAFNGTESRHVKLMRIRRLCA